MLRIGLDSVLIICALALLPILLFFLIYLYWIFYKKCRYKKTFVFLTFLLVAISVYFILTRYISPIDLTRDAKHIQILNSLPFFAPNYNLKSSMDEGAAQYVIKALTISSWADIEGGKTQLDFVLRKIIL
jgi:hypothetical protein